MEDRFNGFQAFPNPNMVVQIVVVVSRYIVCRSFECKWTTFCSFFCLYQLHNPRIDSLSDGILLRSQRFFLSGFTRVDLEQPFHLNQLKGSICEKASREVFQCLVHHLDRMARSPIVPAK